MRQDEGARATTYDEQQVGQLRSDSRQKLDGCAVEPVEIFEDQRARGPVEIGKQCNNQRFNTGGPRRSDYLSSESGFGKAYIDDVPQQGQP